MRAPASDLDATERELREALAPSIQVLRPIGRGAMGAVFLARDPALKRDVVIKVLAPELAHDSVARQRFAREAETAAAVAHPNVVDIFRVGELPQSGTGYFIMRRVDGPTLGERFPLGSRLPQARARRLIGEIASALAAAHARGLVHRDIKPSNIMLDGPAERIIVLDFGISAAATPEHAAGEERLTLQGTSIGTPAYMSPEQAAGDSASDRSDVYSLGIVAFELLTGRMPFDARTPMALAAAHIKDVPPLVATLRPDLDPAFSGLVDRMLAKDPARRPSAEEVARTVLPGAHLIEWPPPGLERMKGVGAIGLRCLSAAAVMMPFCLVIGSSPREVGPYLLSALLTFATIMLASVAIFYLGLASRAVRIAHRQGYPVSVGFDVALDRADDTVAMLNGSGHYAPLGQDVAWRWLRRRRWDAMARFAGASIGLLTCALWSMGIVRVADIRSADSVTFAGFLWMIGPGVAGLLVGAVLRAPESMMRRRRLPTNFVRAHDPHAVPPELVEAWASSAGRPSASRPRRANSVIIAVEWAMAALVLLVSANLTARAVVGMLGSISSAATPLNATQHAALRSSIAQGAGLPSLDSTLAAHGIARRDGPADTSAVREIVSAPDVAGMDPAIVWQAFSILPGSLPADLARTLDTAAQRHTLDALRRVIVTGQPPVMWYAPRTELSSGLMSASSRLADPVRRLAMRNLAASAVALSRGDKSAAVQRARENVSAGRLLTLEPIASTYLRGVGIAASGARALEEIGIATGDRALVREGKSLAAALAGAREREDRFSPISLGRLGSRPEDTLLLSLAGNRRLLPVERWSAAAALARGACWNEAELRTGIAPSRHRALDEAARRLADISRSDAWIAAQHQFLSAMEHETAPKEFDLALPPVVDRLRPAARTLLCGIGR